MTSNQLPPSQPEPPQEQAPASQARPIQIPFRWVLPAKKPWATYALIGITLAVYVAQLISQNITGVDLVAALGMKINDAIANGQYWRFITPVFLHGSIIHIAFNMYALYALGPGLELHYGHERFLILYFVGGLAGVVFSFLFSKSASLGASTAIFGLLGAQGVFIYQNRKLYRNARSMLMNLLMFLAINLVMGFSGIFDNWGHLGGLLGGLAYSWLAGPLWEAQRSADGIDVLDKRSPRNARIIGIGLLLYFILMGVIGIVRY
jgi:rhomboid protease GluP